VHLVLLKIVLKIVFFIHIISYLLIVMKFINENQNNKQIQLKIMNKMKMEYKHQQQQLRMLLDQVLKVYNFGIILCIY